MLVDIPNAKVLLSQGKVIAVPTDTVYGLVCDIENHRAAEEIFTLKGRDETKPLIAFLGDTLLVENYVDEPPQSFYDYSEKFWPGALTLILPIPQDRVHQRIVSGGTTLGFRMPNHPELLQLLKEFGVLASTSANLSGQPPFKTVKEIEQAFGEDFPVLEGKIPQNGTPSSILLYSGNQWGLLREGGIPKGELL